eukprot:6188267-Pleurochrysis_carterae.AAC.3
MAAETHKHFGCESLHNSKMGKTQVRGHVGNGMAKRCPASQSPGVVRQDTRLHQHPPKPSLKLYLTGANKLALPNLSDSSVTRSNPRTPIRNTCKPLARSTEDELQTLCAATAVEPVPWNVLLSSVYRKYDLEVALELVAEREDARVVAAAIAVVGRRPDGYKLLREHVLVPLLHQLVRTADEFKPVDLVELRGHLGAKEPASSTRTEVTHTLTA